MTKRKCFELPKWFKLNNYSHLSTDCSNHILFRELRTRQEIYIKALNCPSSLASNEPWSDIKTQGGRSSRRRRRVTPKFVYTQEIANDFKIDPVDNKTICVSIDLSGPKDIILQEIDTLITHTRQTRALQTKRRLAGNRILHNLKSYKIIPLADLLIHEMEQDCKFPDKFLNQALFNGDYNDEAGAAFVRRNVKKLFSKTMNSNLIDELEFSLKIPLVRR